MIRILQGDHVVDRPLRRLAACSVDVVICDPPYELGFMGKGWDSREVAYDVSVWADVLAAMKPGAHLLAFGGTRTYHRLACAIEDAGFEIRDCLMWVYGTGFPKSHNLGEGRGTALKPAWEPILLARKPFAGTTEACVEEFGTGGLNIEACRVGSEGGTTKADRTAKSDGVNIFGWSLNGSFGVPINAGRWPANLLHDGSDEVVEAFPDSAGPDARGDSGSASRFFYCAKASRADREEGCEDLTPQKRDESRNADQPSMNGGEGNAYNRGAVPRKNNHPTVKPTELMRYLCRLVTPPGGIVLDPFMGSGSTGKAAVLEGLSFIGIDRDLGYCEISAARIAWAQAQHGKAA